MRFSFKYSFGLNRVHDKCHVGKYVTTAHAERRAQRTQRRLDSCYPLRPLLYSTVVHPLMLVLVFMWVSCSESASSPEQDNPADTTAVEMKPDSIDLGTGLVVADGYQMVRQQCLTCHSSKLITQNRATREGWENMIRWMQQTQKLPELGPAEGPILDYLAAHYAPKEHGRRAALVVEEWYEIEE